MKSILTALLLVTTFSTQAMLTDEEIAENEKNYK